MVLLAVSGGPDSMFLLNKYKKRNIVVAHVNYHKRLDSNVDQNVVASFCHKHHIALEILDAPPITGGNFQDQARTIRYQFFKRVYHKHHCDQLLTAHHKDDFIETALMQQASKRLPTQFGMAKKIRLWGMNVYRPLINTYYKHEIRAWVDKHNIKYTIDSSNSELQYQRNKIRNGLQAKTAKEKDDLFGWFVMANKILRKKHKRINKVYHKWEKSRFLLKKFRALERDKIHLVYKYVHHHFDNIKVSEPKLQSLIDFIEGGKGNVLFKLNDHNAIKKENGILKNIKTPVENMANLRRP